MPPKKKKVAKKKTQKKRILKKKPIKRAVKKSLKKKRPILKKKKPVLKKKKSLVKKVKKPVIKEAVIGEITHYFPHVSAAVVKLKMPLSVGEAIHVKGHTTDFKETIASLQIDHVPVNMAKPGDEIGLLVKSRVRAGDKVYKA